MTLHNNNKGSAYSYEMGARTNAAKKSRMKKHIPIAHKKSQLGAPKR